MPLFPIETDRLILRALEPLDAGRIEKYVSDPDVVRHVASLPNPLPAGFAISWIKEMNKNMLTRHNYAAAIACKETGALMGVVSLCFPDYAKGGEIGYWLGKPHRGQGYATEAVRKMVVVAFNRLGLHRVWAGVVHGNEESIRVLEKAGLVLEGEGECRFVSCDQPKPASIYGLNRRDAVAKKDILGAAIMAS